MVVATVLGMPFCPRCLWLQSRGCRFSNCACGDDSGRVRVGKTVLSLQSQRERFCDMSTTIGPRIPGSGREGYCSLVFNSQLSVGRLTGGTVDRCPGRHLHASKPEAPADYLHLIMFSMK